VACEMMVSMAEVEAWTRLFNIHSPRVPVVYISKSGAIQPRDENWQMARHSNLTDMVAIGRYGRSPVRAQLTGIFGLPYGVGTTNKYSAVPGRSSYSRGQKYE